MISRLYTTGLYESGIAVVMVQWLRPLALVPAARVRFPTRVAFFVLAKLTDLSD